MGTLTLLTCADRSTYTKTESKFTGRVILKKNRKWMPPKQLIGCRCVKFFLTNYYCKKFFFDQKFNCWVCSQFELLRFVTIWVVEFCHNLSFWKFSKLELSFVPFEVFEFCYNTSFWVLLQLKFLSFVTICSRRLVVGWSKRFVKNWPLEY